MLQLCTLLLLSAIPARTLASVSRRDVTPSAAVFHSELGDLPGPSRSDYDYDADYVERTNEFVPTLRARLFTAPVERSYNQLTHRHHYHPNIADVAAHRKHSFSPQGSIGRIIPMYIADRRPMLHQVCPQLTQLFYVQNPTTGSLYLTIDYAEVATRLAQGWRQLNSIGLCVRSTHPGVCGASRPLMHLTAVTAKGNDDLYTTDDSEYDRVNNQDASYKGSGHGPICYLW